MFKKELIEEIAKKGGFKSSEVKNFLKAELEVMEESLNKGKDISLIGFGSFRVRMRKAHNAFNPAKRKKMVVQAKKVVSFRASKKLLSKSTH
jgi:DNA-binding protein HU-beta